jgi:hypothetical protein
MFLEENKMPIDFEIRDLKKDSKKQRRMVGRLFSAGREFSAKGGKLAARR